jgi:hypothetical protein
MNERTSDVDRPENEVIERELTAEELLSVGGGVRICETEAWAVFKLGIIKGFEEAQPGSCGILF